MNHSFNEIPLMTMKF
uniref:Cytochrome oxidase subunit I n=1 Tax=Andrena aff. manifesta LLL-2002 TaxID=205242 RepID=Q71GT0_9HYME|nr:cytochrome oxidase subunit I [Andrena aff. manifesta LLL-2002]